MEVRSEVVGQESTVFPALQTENSKRTAATGSNNLNVIEMITRYRQKGEHNEIVGVEAIIKIPF